ncbi:homocysteine S-methyltransferase family protein, partial [bacterium]|nr:homocysteine S-methyltransferase family protein [candidate division CSSED10-310 bacterium]
IAAGLTRGDAAERWNLDHAPLILDIHRSYALAGADILTTNTFGATRGHLEKHGLAGNLAEINAAAVRLAKKAAGADRLVAGDLGPTGALLPPMGAATEQHLRDLFKEQAEILLDAGVDFYLTETHYDLREAVCAVQSARSCCDLPIGATITFNRSPRGYRTMMGDTVENCCTALAEAGADFIGANCTLEPSAMVELAGELVHHSRLPILIQPNAGQPHLRNGRTTYDVSPRVFAEEIRAILAAGVRAVGGCCGTTPEHITAMRELIDGFAGGTCFEEAT